MRVLDEAERLFGHFGLFTWFGNRRQPRARVTVERGSHVVGFSPPQATAGSNSSSIVTPARLTLGNGGELLFDQVRVACEPGNE